MNIVIRMAEEPDVPLILWFIKHIAEYEKLSNEVTATEEMLRESLFGTKRAAEVLLCTVDGAPAGYAVFFHNFSTFTGKRGLYLEDIFVLPEYREKRIGKKLFNRLLQIARERNCGRMDWAVLDWNNLAIGFYKKIGATMLSDWKLFRLTETEIDRLLI
jgi:GNAT superfamily N-acetyltransferase